MGWLDDAEKIIPQKNNTTCESENKSCLFLNTEQEINNFKKIISHYYENASDREMDFAIEKIKERFDAPYSEKEVLNYIKQFLD